REIEMSASGHGVEWERLWNGVVLRCGVRPREVKHRCLVGLDPIGRNTEELQSKLPNRSVIKKSESTSIIPPSPASRTPGEPKPRREVVPIATVGGTRYSFVAGVHHSYWGVRKNR